MPTLMLKAGEHPKVVSERRGHASIAITMDTYSHLPGPQESAAERFDSIVNEGLLAESSGNDVCRMFASANGIERRPYRSRTYDTLIKSHGVLI